MEQWTIAEEEEIREAIGEMLASVVRDKGQLIPVLQKVQDRFGYLPQEAIGEISTHLGMTDVQIYGVASFYNHFRFIPLGKHPVQVCMGTACHLAGGGLVLESLERELDVEVDGITEDKEFSLDRVACIGCCGLAPVMLIGEKIYPKITPTKVKEALVTLKMEEEEAAKGEAEVQGNEGE